MCWYCRIHNDILQPSIFLFFFFFADVKQLTLSIIGLSTVNMPRAVSPIGGPDSRFKKVVTWSLNR